MRLWIVLLAVALAGCGGVMRIAYNNGDFALRTVAYEYLDLRDEQQDLLKSQLARFHEWHRREELPEYAAMLQGAADRIGRGLTRADVLWAVAAVRDRYRSVVAQAAEDGAPVLARLGPDNYAALEKKLAESNQKFAAEYLAGDQAKRDRARAKWLEERFEFFMGSLTDAQRALVARIVEAQPRMSAVRLGDRKRRQEEFVRLVKSYRSSPDLAERLRGQLLDWERDRSPEHARLAREWEERLVELVLDIDRTLTPDQRERAVQRLRSLAEDCRVLAQQGRPDGATAALAVGAAIRPPSGFE
jgi:hypothetical protein